ncbi:MAG: penicillin acylase family protein [Anaerolineae bacterium]
MKRIRLILIVVLMLVIGVGIGVSLMVNQWTRGPLPDQDGTVTLDGLNDTVTVIRDTYSVPHIYASNVADLRFAQGYVQAQDRWWQMEFWRHTGRGRIQELTGQSSALTGTDIFIRTIGWEEASQRDLDAMPADVIAELQAFADGVNAYINSRPIGELAFEYNVLGLTGVEFEIEPWTPLDTVVWTKVMAWDLSGSNRGNELTYSALADEFGESMAAFYQPDFDYENFPTIIQTEDLPASGDTFETPFMQDTAGIRGIQTQLAGNYDPRSYLVFGQGDEVGSNNWVVSGDLTASGMPLLANDPHLGIQNPSIWYEVGLYCQPISADCPYYNRGFAFSASPGVIIGNNASIGWGVTNVGSDILDLYRMEFNPDNPLQYRWNGEWRDAELREEVIHFGNGGSMTINVRVTHLGAIINDNQLDDDGNILGYNQDNPLALRWTGDEQGTIIESIFRLNRANNWEEFREAIRYWDVPAQNIVYADMEGNIGYQTQGRFPIRAEGHTGLMPVDGTTDQYEWLGYVPYEYIPSVLNPERGYISTANQALLPQAYYAYLAQELGEEFGEDAHYVFDYDWDAGYRGTRINELLEATDAHDFESFSAIHGDNKFLFAEAIASDLMTIDMDSDELNEMRDWMLDWDYQMHVDSAQGALFGRFWQALVAGIFNDELAVIDSSADGNDQNMLVTQRLMAQSDHSWWDDISTDEITESRDLIVQSAFAEAVDATRDAQGDDRDGWRWGAFHQADFISNPLGASGIALIEDMVNTSDVETGGGRAIVNATGWNFSTENGLRVSSVPSMRMILDFSDFSNNRSIHTTGQSGHPMSPAFDDMVETWRTINYNPMLLFESDVEANAQSTLVLAPAD